MKWWDRIKNKPFFIRLLNWEYWSVYTLYLPLSVYFPFLALRSRHPCFFTAANPGILTGGMGMESKYKTLMKIPEGFRPKTTIALHGEAFNDLLKKIEDVQIQYPIIVKPDIGYRGFLVRKINSANELKSYITKYPIDFVVQEFIDLPAEFGVLYYRFPNKKNGKVTSITLKEFLHVIGDGKSTVLELILAKPRAKLQLERLNKTYKHLFNNIPLAGERVPLGVIGNHSKGTIFRNGNHLIDQQIRETFDQISGQIEGIYYGRYDIKSTSLEDLKQGKNIKIIEINGVCSEPTHIYDPFKSSYFQALLDIARHWYIIERIGAANHQLGVPYMKPMEMIRAIRDLSKYFKFIKKAVEI